MALLVHAFNIDIGIGRRLQLHKLQAPALIREDQATCLQNIGGLRALRAL
jgi:hypothetical protein